MLIRPLQEKDLDQAAELEAKNFSCPWSRQAFADALKKEYYLYLAAVEEDETMLGICGLIRSFDEGEITNVAVSDKARRRGIAYQMLTELMKQAQEQGIRAFTLEVRKSNAPAIGLYQKLGFLPEGIRPGFYEAPVEDAVIMWKR